MLVKKRLKKLSLSRETVRDLQRDLTGVAGGATDTCDRTCGCTLDRTCYCTLDRTCYCTQDRTCTC